MRRLLPVLTAAALLAGCTEPAGRYPSLLPRAIESRSDAEPVRPVAVATPDAALDGRIAALNAVLARAAADFSRSAEAAEARVAVAAGTARGSEAWIEAQSALAELDAARGATLGGLADLETLTIDRGAAGQPPYPALDAAVTAARAQSERQSARIAMLEASIGS